MGYKIWGILLHDPVPVHDYTVVVAVIYIFIRIRLIIHGRHLDKVERVAGLEDITLELVIGIFRNQVHLCGPARKTCRFDGESGQVLQ